MLSSIFKLLIALGIITTTPMAMASTLGETVLRGKEAMLRGDYSRAIAIFLEAKENLLNKSDPVDRILLNNYLALSYLEMGDPTQAKGAITQAIQILDKHQLNSNLVAQVRNTQANVQLKQGDFQTAALNFRISKQLYQQNKDIEGKVGTAINEAIALQKLGQHRTAQKILAQVELDLASMPKHLQASGYKVLGTTYASLGDLDTAKAKLQASIALTEGIDIEATAKTQIDLATVIHLSQPEAAIKLLQAAATKSQNQETKAISALNWVGIEIKAENWQKAREIALNSQDLVFNLSYNDLAKINLIKKIAIIDTNSPHQSVILTNNSIRQQHQQLLKEIAQSVHAQGNIRTESYAIGTWAYLEELEGNIPRAIELNKYALDLTDKIAAQDIAYQWQWQLGKIYKNQGDIPRAIASYQKAVEYLSQIRRDLVGFNPESQYSFRESVEPVYRQLVSLLISQPTQANLIAARSTIESLQIAELENYFRQACLEAKPEQIEEIDPTAATIYPIVTEDYLAVLTSIPGQPIKLHIESIAAKDIDQKAQELLALFNPASSNKKRKALSQEFYNWLIKPRVNELKTANIKTLVFVLNGSLRNLPISALYDGEKYLVENYAVAFTPGLQLLPSKTLTNQNLKAIVAGLSEQNQGFVALPGVETEVKEIAAKVNSKLLLNQDFTKERLRQVLKASKTAPILHFATHGQFSSNPEETFILTWNDRIHVNELEQLLKIREETSQLIPIELLILSACQTAQGDAQAALGIAGVALKSGARSTLGTLWSVSDLSTSLLVDELYRQIAIAPQNKAQILRQAQLKLINSDRFNHPFFWAAFVLIGNWT